MKKPPSNSSIEAVALRKAALAFAAHSTTESGDDQDRQGQRLNAALMRAAEKYAARVLSSEMQAYIETSPEGGGVEVAIDRLRDGR